MFADPPKFIHWRTDYEACMSGGTRDDIIVKSFVIDVTSNRGSDVTLVNQYCDAIIFDCITSTQQAPIQFPFDKGFEENLELCKKIKVVQVPMIMDSEGDIYFMITNDKDKIKIVRVNGVAEMGNDDFF